MKLFSLVRPYFFVFAILLVSFLSSGQTSGKKYLGIGDIAPALKPYKWIKGEAIEKFEKGHIYVVEFGSTWCVPCKAAIPKLWRVAQKYKKSVSVVSLFVMELLSDKTIKGVPEHVLNVEKFVDKEGQKMEYIVGVDDSQATLEYTWLKKAGKNGIPYIFVIDKQGRIAWIGSNADLLDSILTIVNGKDYSIERMLPLPEAVEIGEASRSKLMKEINDPDNAAYLSSFSIYKDGQQELFDFSTPLHITSYRWAKPGSDIADLQGKIRCIGTGLRSLYNLAYSDTLWNSPQQMNLSTGEYQDPALYENARRSYGQFWYKPIFEMSDSSQFESDYKSPDNRFNYYLQMPLHKASSYNLQKAMQRDLMTYFDYDVSVEVRDMPCWKLQLVNDSARIKLIAKNPENGFKLYADETGTHIKSGEVRDIIFQLDIRYGHGAIAKNLIYDPSTEPPFIDETGINEKIDYSYSADIYKTYLKPGQKMQDLSFEHYQLMLNSMGFKLVQGTKPMKVVVIRDGLNK